AFGRVLETAPARGGGHAGIRENALVISQYPSLGSPGRCLDARYAIKHMGRRATGPHVWGFGHVSVGVDNGGATHCCFSFFNGDSLCAGFGSPVKSTIPATASFR